MREIIIRNIDNAPNGKEFFAGISGNFKNFGQTLCELIDNPISNFRAHGIRGRVEIVLEEQGDYVEVSVRDNGTGIENMDAALTIAARSCAESTLNEHGMGLKHALASINAGEDQHWSIQTRTAEDVANDRYQRAEGPYDIHMPVSMIPGSGEVAGGTGTVVRVRCPMHKFLTLKPASKKEEPTFGQMAAYLRETLRYTYANLLRDKAFTICFTAVDKSGASPGGDRSGRRAGDHLLPLRKHPPQQGKRLLLPRQHGLQRRGDPDQRPRHSARTVQRDLGEGPTPQPEPLPRPDRHSQRSGGGPAGYQGGEKRSA